MFAKLPSSLLAMSLIVLLPGCSKPKEATPPPVSATPPAQVEGGQATPNTPVTPVPPPPAAVANRGRGGPPSLPPPQPMPVAPPQNGNFNATLSDLSMQLRLYVSRTRTAPKTYGEFVANTGVAAPEPPPGMHYAIRSGAVVLER
jgi:hypothetical protein